MPQLETLLDESTLSAGSSATGSSFDTDRFYKICVQAQVTGNSSATADLRVHIRGSNDNSNWDTVDIGTDNSGYFDVPVSDDGGNEVISSAAVNAGYPYLRPVVENLDSTYSATGVKVTAKGDFLETT